MEDISEFVQTLPTIYDRRKLPGISRRHFKHSEMMEILGRLQSSYPDLFSIKQAGTSVEGRSINLITLGRGRAKILMWSQMHGDESTATRAILDMINLIGSNQSESFIKTILDGTTLLLLPMVNPDGAERYQRRNAQGIDINRDGVALQTPEARVLKAVRDEFQAEFGFNLHDQDPRFAVGKSNRIAAIALLAPAYDEAKSTNQVRQQAKLLAAFLAETISHFAPGHVSRFDETFDPRAFGDAMQAWGTSTVLVESGGWLNDPEKEFLRKLNAIGLLAACYAIATGEFRNADIALYESLLENNKNVFDVTIKNASYKLAGSSVPIQIDVGINIEEQVNGETREVKRIPKVVDIGDLTPFQSFCTIDASGRVLSIPLLAIGSIFPLEDLETSRLFQV